MLGSPPGPVGTGRYALIDDGTLSRASTLPPSPTGVKPPPPSTVAGTDPAIEALQLRGAAKRGGDALKQAHPSVKFTSGRRGQSDPARAMASKCALKRERNAQTHVGTAVSCAC